MKATMCEKWDEIFRMAKNVGKIYHKLALHYNLSDSAFWIIYTLYQTPEGCTQTDICYNTSLTKQTVNSSISNLEKDGYIILKNDKNNKRNKNIFLTEMGKELASKTIQQVTQIEDKVYGKMDENEMNLVVEIFTKQVEIFSEMVNKEIGNKEDKE